MSNAETKIKTAQVLAYSLPGTGDPQVDEMAVRLRQAIMATASNDDTTLREIASWVAENDTRAFAFIYAALRFHGEIVADLIPADELDALIDLQVEESFNIT